MNATNIPVLNYELCANRMHKLLFCNVCNNKLIIDGENIIHNYNATYNEVNLVLYHCHAHIYDIIINRKYNNSYHSDFDCNWTVPLDIIFKFCRGLDNFNICILK